MTAEIRRLTGADAALWQALRLEGLEEMPTAFLTTLEEARARRLEEVAARLDSSVTLGAMAERLVGMLTLAPMAGRAAHRGDIFAVYVAPEWRGRGLGRRLLDEAARIGRERGLLQLELHVEAENAAALKLYAAAGFEVTGRIPRAMREAKGFSDDLMMVRRLDA